MYKQPSLLSKMPAMVFSILQLLGGLLLLRQYIYDLFDLNTASYTDDYVIIISIYVSIFFTFLIL